MGEEDHTEDVQQNISIALIFVTGIIAYGGSIVPWHLKRCFRGPILDTLNVFSALAAGLVFGAFMLHMLPEASYALTEYATHAADEEHPNHSLGAFPWAPLLASLTCVLLIAIDRAVVSKGLLGQNDSHSHDHISEAFGTMRDLEANGGAGDVSSNAKAADGVADAALSKAPATAASVVPSSSSSSSSSSSPSSAEAASSTSAASADKDAIVAIASASPAFSSGSAASEQQHHHTAAAHKEAILRAWVFFAALSLHSIFDGLATGMGAGHAHGGEEEEASEDAGLATKTALAVAVVVHKLFDGVALGVPVYLANMKGLHATLLLVACALTTPLGIAIGMGAKEALEGSSTTELAEGVILSLSGGSFLFIALVELLPSSLHDGRLLKTKVAAFTVGLLAMAGLAAAE